MIEVYIPSVGPGRPSPERARTVFKVDVLFNGRKHSLERRYSEFHALHKRIKKACKVPDFPPKRVPNWLPKMMEQRRQALEAYIQGVLWENQDVPKEVFEFLKVRHFPHSHRNSSIDSLIELMPEENSLLLCHQPMVGFLRDPYVLPSSTDPFPDIIASGVLQGLSTQNVNNSHTWKPSWCNLTNTLDPEGGCDTEPTNQSPGRETGFAYEKLCCSK